MDGVLVDSEQFICEAATMMFKELGINVLPDDFNPFASEWVRTGISEELRKSMV